MQSSVGHILGIVAAIVRGVAAVIAAVMLVYALFILFGANPTNGLVTFTQSIYDSFGGFTKDLFTTSSNPKYSAAINVGLAEMLKGGVIMDVTNRGQGGAGGSFRELHQALRRRKVEGSCERRRPAPD